jgi:murein L,D-transpeptidase YafK
MKQLFLVLSVFFISSFLPPSDFLTEQKKFAHVKVAYKEKESLITSTLKKNNISKDNVSIVVVVYKHEQLMELYAKNKNDEAYKKIESYKICSSSGVLGPKRKQGDGQVPEGFYNIDRFNPSSSFYLSLGISYPNLSDKRKSKFTDLGGDIFIHGDCVTIGCMPMTDDKMKEIYIYALQAKHSGQSKIPVYIFPYKMTNENMKSFANEYKNQKELLEFWKNLKTGYDKFIRDLKELNSSVDKNGDYLFE